jgi:hypothetical protein
MSEDGNLIVACIRVGERYCFDPITALRNRVERTLHRPYTMVCLTDQPERCSRVSFVDVSALDLKGAWAKIILFEPAWRGFAKVIYFDLDIEPVGDITPLADVPGEFARHNSSVMVIGGGNAGFIWQSFDRRRASLIAEHGCFDACIEALYPRAPRLAGMLPKDFFGAHLRSMRVHRKIVNSENSA